MCVPAQAIDLVDEAGSRVRITAYQARRSLAEHESPKVHEYLQVMETKDEAVKEGLYEEAVILHRRQNEYMWVQGTGGQGTAVRDVCLAWSPFHAACHLVCSLPVT